MKCYWCGRRTDHGWTCSPACAAAAKASLDPQARPATRVAADPDAVYRAVYYMLGLIPDPEAP